jgi:hypothetical protein
VGGRASKLAACAAIVCIGGTVLGLGVSHLLRFDGKFLAGSVAARAERSYRQELCLFQGIRRDVPRGAGVYLAGNSVAHTQRLAELSTLWAVPKENRRAAQWALTITKLHSSGRPRRPRGTRQYRCYGDLLMVREI